MARATMIAAGRRDRVLAAFLDATLRAGIPYWWRPRGFSMSPTINDGDRVLVTSVCPADLRPGDIVKFRFGGQLLLHRLVAREASPGGAYFTFRGDNSAETQTSVVSEDIIGRAIAVERAGSMLPLPRELGWWPWKGFTRLLPR